MKKRFLIGGIGALALLAGAGGYYYTQQGQPAAGGESRYSKLFVVGALDHVHAVDLKTGEKIKEIPVGLIPHNLLLSGDGKKLYVSNVGSQSVSVIDTEKLEKVGDILVGEMPKDLPQHAKVDPAKLKSSNTCFECHQVRGVGTLPNALAWAPGEKALLVNEIRERSVTWLDTENRKTIRQHRFELPTPTAPANMAVHPDSGEIWVLHRHEAEEYDKKKHESLGADTMADFNHDPPAGQKTTWVTVHDPEMKQELARIKMDLAVPFGSVFSPDGRWLYVAYRSSNIIAVFDTKTHQLDRTFEVGTSPVGLALTPDGKELYVTCLFSVPPVVQIVDVETGEVKVSMGVPPSASLVRVDETTGLVYVTATGYNAVIEIDPKAMAITREFSAGHQP
ncbi:MAG: YncE family protein, partial [Candidatus Sericytochromatia bacterium]